MSSIIQVKSKEAEKFEKELASKKDPESLRMRRFLTMPDLSRMPDSPIYELVQRLLELPDFKDFDVIEDPEIVPAEISFDLFDFPSDHPARSRSDTYYVDDKNILRTHTTVMWYYYLQNEKIKERIKKNESVGSLSYGKVYRKDEIDRQHMNVFHQMDGWYLCPKDQKIITVEDLQNVLVKIAQAIYGPGIEYRFNKDTFPYTDPSIEMEISRDGKWVEVLGSGVVKGRVLDKLGVDSSKYNGWAFGFGLERLAMISMNLPDIRLLWSEDERIKKQLRLGHIFKEVSKYPPIIRDFSFIVDKNFIPNNYYDMIRDLGGDLIEEVKLIDEYKDSKKIGPNKTSYTFRAVFRCIDRTLTIKEVEPIQNKIYEETARQFKAEIR